MNYKSPKKKKIPMDSINLQFLPTVAIAQMLHCTPNPAP